MSSSGSSTSPRPAGTTLTVALLAAVFAAALGAVTLTPESGTVAAWYPAAGVSVALLTISPRSRWLALAASVVVLTGVASVLGGRDVGPTAAFAIGTGAEALVAAWVLRRDRDRIPTLDRVEDLVRLLVASVLGALVVTAVAVFATTALTNHEPAQVARTFFSSHCAATLVVVPAVLVWRTHRGPLRRPAESAIQGGVLVAATLAAFWPGQGISIEFAPLPMLVWAALRLDLRILTLELLVTSGLVSVLSMHGGGPFGYDLERGAVGAAGIATLVQVYLLTSVLITVPLAVTVDQRRRLIAELAHSEKLTAATLDTTAAMILVTDLEGEVVRVNAATTALTGYPEEELLGLDIGELPFAPPESSGFPAGLPEHPTAVVSRETGLVTRSGGERRVHWNTGFVRDERDHPTHVVITGTDLTAERAAASLNRHLLEAAITTALIGIDRAGRITVFNAGAVNLLGYDAQDMVGRSFVDLLDPAQVAERYPGTTAEECFDLLVSGIEAGEATAARDWRWVGADGHRHTISTTISLAAEPIAARSGYLCVGRDVTEARASQEMLVAALEKERLAVQRMKKLDEVKNEFVSTVSHELRTPVTSIVGYTELLEDGSIVDPVTEQRPLLASIARNGRRLILLCDDLLTLGGLDSGATAWQRNAVDLAAIVAGAEDAVRTHLAGRDLHLTLAAPDRPVPVLGDRDQLERALTNLLSNAVKFSEDGGRIEARVESRDGEAWLTVADTGIGIPVEEQERLFQRFFRSSTAQERAIQGTGLGLSIVSSIVAAHGGRIEVRSAHLEGTTFTVRLPLARG